MQKYCGCIFSEEQSQLAIKNVMPKLPDNFEFLPVERSVIIRKERENKEQYRGMGYGKQMIKYLADNYKQKYKRMIVGTTENNIPFYVKQGFYKYEKTIKNFFIDNYDEELWDGSLHCVDMYYYSKDLMMSNSKKK